MSVKPGYLLYTNDTFLTRECTDELLHTFSEQRVLNIFSLFFFQIFPAGKPHYFSA